MKRHAEPRTRFRAGSVWLLTIWLGAAKSGCEPVHLSLLEPQSSGTDRGDAGGSGAAGAAGAAGAEGGGEAGQGEISSPIVWKNLMLIKTSAELEDGAFAFEETEIADITDTFKVSFPALVADLTGGRVVLENEVQISEVPITSLGYLDDMVEPENVPDWTEYVTAPGIFDVLVLMSPRPQTPYARGSLAQAPWVGWGSVGAQPEFSTYAEELDAWLFVWLAEIANIFYSGKLGLADVPRVSQPSDYGYGYQQGGYMGYVAYYKDVLNREVWFENRAWGLGEPAWSLGTLRDWAANQ